MALLGIPDLPERAFIRKVDGSILPQGGGGGQPTSTTSTTNTSNIPSYAQPYVENMLGATQSQLFKTQGATDANGNPTIDPNTGQQVQNISGFNPYQAYGSTNPDGSQATPTQAAQAAVAGFSPLQQQAQSSAANLQVPGQYGQAAGLTGMGIGKSMNIGNQMNQLGQSATPQDFQNQVGGYMNPYINQTLAPSMQLLNQQYGQQGAAEQGAATSAGAFGGSREAVMQGLNQQNQMLAQNQLVGNAYNNAFNSAQNQYNQAGAFQMQGLQNQLGATNQAMQGANQLANIGGQNLAAQQSILGTQAQQGQVQQANQQQVINQAIQNYSNAQQYPMMQLGLMSNMLHGLPLQSTTTNQYQAAPNSLLQGIGVAGAGASIYNALNPTSKKKGGITEAVPRHYAGVLASVNDELENIGAIDPSALAKYAKQTKSPELRRLIQEKAGIPLAPTNMGDAAPGGGIVALAEGGVPGYAEGVLTQAELNQQVNNLVRRNASDIAANVSDSSAPVPDSPVIGTGANVTPTQARQKVIANNMPNPATPAAEIRPNIAQQYAEKVPDSGLANIYNFVANGGVDKLRQGMSGSERGLLEPTSGSKFSSSAQSNAPTPGGIAGSADPLATNVRPPAATQQGTNPAGFQSSLSRLTPEQVAAIEQAQRGTNPAGFESSLSKLTSTQGAVIEQANKDRVAAETKAKVAAAPKETKEAVKKDVLKKEADKATVLAKDEKKVVEKVDDAAQDSDFMPKNYGQDVKKYTDELKSTIGLGPDSYKKMDALNKEYENRVLGMDQQAYIMRNLNAAQTFGKLASFRGPVGAGIAAAVGDFASNEANLQDKMQAMKIDALKGQAEIEKGKRAEELGLWTLAAQHYDKASEIAANLKATKMKGDSDLKNTEEHNKGAKEVANINATSAENVENKRASSAEKVEKLRLEGQNVPEAHKQETLKNIAADLKASLKRTPTQEEILSAYTRATTPSAESNEQRARSNASKNYEAWENTLFIREGDLMNKAKKGDKDAIAKLERLKQDKYDQLLTREMGAVNARPTTSPDIAKGKEVTYQGKTFVFQGGDQYDKNNWKAK